MASQHISLHHETDSLQGLMDGSGMQQMAAWKTVHLKCSTIESTQVYKWEFLVFKCDRLRETIPVNTAYNPGQMSGNE
jgi:hypothetical protein